MNQRNKDLLYFIAGGILLLYSAAVLLLHAFNPLYDIVQKGQIGDAIGGITSPIVGLIGAFLVYKSFMAQVEANNIQREALNEQTRINNVTNTYNTLFDVFKRISEDYENLEFVHVARRPAAVTKVASQRAHKLRGRSAINAFISSYKNPAADVHLMQIPIIKDFQYILHIYNTILGKAISYPFEIDDKELLLSIFLNFYKTKMNWQVDNLKRICEKGSHADVLINLLNNIQVKIENVERILDVH